MKVNLFVAGFSKCGTSTLYDVLNDFDEIEVGTSKEPKFFSTAPGYDETGNLMDWANGGNFANGFDWYRKIFRGCDPNAKYLLDASTIYGFDPNSPQLIYDHNPNAKIVFMVRRPYERIESHYFQEVKFGMELPDYDQFINSNHSRLKFYKAVSRYKATIQGYLSYFPKDQIKVISLNEFKNNPDAVVKDLSQFLKVRPVKLNTIRHSNIRKIPRFAKLKNLLVSIERSKLASKLPREIQEIGSNVTRKIDKILLKNIDDKPKISQSTIDEIENEFLDDLRFLEKEFNLKL